MENSTQLTINTIEQSSHLFSSTTNNPSQPNSENFNDNQNSITQILINPMVSVVHNQLIQNSNLQQQVWRQIIYCDYNNCIKNKKKNCTALKLQEL